MQRYNESVNLEHSFIDTQLAYNRLMFYEANRDRKKSRAGHIQDFMLTKQARHEPQSSDDMLAILKAWGQAVNGE
jgi:hypothetical protein